MATTSSDKPTSHRWLIAVLLSAVPLVALSPLLLSGGEAVKQAEGEGKQNKLLKLFSDITGNMELIEEMLKKRESGPGCQGSQRKLVTRIDELVEELKKCQCSGGGGGRGKNMPQHSEQENEEQKASKKRAKSQQQGRKPQQGKNQPDSKKGGKQGERERPGKVPNVRKGDEKPSPVGVEGPLTEKRGTAAWGFLPGEVRALLEAGRRNSLPSKYVEVIRRYFQRLSEENQTK